MSIDKLTRREFLKKVSKVGLGALIGSSTSCKKEEGKIHTA